MADEVENFHTCDQCGSTIYPEHIERKVAVRRDGQLLCHHCVEEAADPHGDKVDLDHDSIALADANSAGASQIRAFGGGPGGMSESMVGAAVQADLKRPLLRNSPNATRCRTFHGKLTDASLAYMSDQINAWVDEHEEIEIKFATSTIGVVEGKHADPHLIVTVFY